jgi:hypothetical protein
MRSHLDDEETMGLSPLSIYIEQASSLIFPLVKTDKVKKNFSEKAHKSRRIAVTAPRKRPIAQGNDTDIPCIIP